MPNFSDFSRLYDWRIRWKHFPRHWPFVWWMHRSPVNSPHKGKWHGALMFSLICAWTNDWGNNRQAGDWGHHRVHYDVTVMKLRLLQVGGRIYPKHAIAKRIVRNMKQNNEIPITACCKSYQLHPGNTQSLERHKYTYWKSELLSVSRYSSLWQYHTEHA